jgi:ubiquinone/menaquinone biosynthesis C-methylase UbiE
MILERKTYKWFYDHIHSYYYNLLMKWCFLPFGGEAGFREAMIASVDFQPRQRILEMCCGTGGATISIQKRMGSSGQIVGMDLSRGQIGRAIRRPELSNIRLVEGNVARTAFRDHSFDKVFITHALHEMPRAIRYQVLAEAQRVLRDSGAVIVLELDEPPSLFVRWFVGFWFFYWLPFNFETPTRRDMLEHGLAEEVKEAGFKHIAKVSKYRGTFQVVRGVK